MSFKRMHKLKRLRSAEVPKNLRTSKSVKLTMLNSVQLPQTFRNQIVQNDLRSSARKYASLEHISCETIVQDISYIRAIAILFVRAKSESRTVPKRNTKILFSRLPPILRFEYAVHAFYTSFRIRFHSCYGNSCTYKSIILSRSFLHTLHIKLIPNLHLVLLQLLFFSFSQKNYLCQWRHA